MNARTRHKLKLFIMDLFVSLFVSLCMAGLITFIVYWFVDMTLGEVFTCSFIAYAIVHTGEKLYKSWRDRNE